MHHDRHVLQACSARPRRGGRTLRAQDASLTLEAMALLCLSRPSPLSPLLLSNTLKHARSALPGLGLITSYRTSMIPYHPSFVACISLTLVDEVLIHIHEERDRLRRPQNTPAFSSLPDTYSLVVTVT